jgi:hypothetical protein
MVIEEEKSDGYSGNSGQADQSTLLGLLVADIGPRYHLLYPHEPL